jgi:hypothetical protein
MIAICAHLLCAPQWTLVDAELDTGTELDAMPWRSDLGCVQHESGCEVQGAAERSARHKARGVSGVRHEARAPRGESSAWHEAWVGA